SPGVGPYDNFLTSISAASPTDIWAVGSWVTDPSGPQTSTLVEHWDGAQWSIVPSPSPGSLGNDLFGVTAIAQDDVWVVGAYFDEPGGKPLIEHWDGAQWQLVASPPL